MLVIGCNNKKNSHGFTLIEILIVLVIIGISTTLITISFNSITSIDKQTSSIEKSIKFLAEESIISGSVVLWYIHPNKEYAAYLVEEGKEKEINGFDNSVWKNFSSYKKTFRYLDGIKIELGKNEPESPILVFYPSGEISGGEIDIYYDNYIQRLIIKTNGKIYNEIINY